MRSEKVVERAYDKLMDMHDFKNKKEESDNILMTESVRMGSTLLVF